MEKIEDSKISGAYEGKKQDTILRDKINEIIDWISEFERPAGTNDGKKRH